jgi:CRP/FNR family cyclic AMP-dependent transcriptional regulator
MKAPAKLPAFDVMAFLKEKNTGMPVATYRENQVVYAQGDPVISEQGKEAVVAIRGPDEFCCEGVLTGAPILLANAVTISTCEIVRIEKNSVVRLLHENAEFGDYFLAHLLTRTARVEADLVDQLFNSSEMRLARALLLLANYGNDVGLEPIPVQVNQQTLAEMIGTTRSRVSLFMNKFRRLGLINYNGKLEVQKALLNFVLNEKPKIDP